MHTYFKAIEWLLFVSAVYSLSQIMFTPGIPGDSREPVVLSWLCYLPVALVAQEGLAQPLNTPP